MKPFPLQGPEDGAISLHVLDKSAAISNAQGRRTRGFRGCMCTPTFTPSPKVYSIELGENSPLLPCSAPALFRALRRQCQCTTSACMPRGCHGHCTILRPSQWKLLHSIKYQ